MTKTLTRIALLSAVALTIFVLEAQIPLPLPLPGLKLGLSNIVTLLALSLLGWKEALCVLCIRMLLGNLVTGQMAALLYSLAGGLLSFACMAIAVKLLPKSQLWVAGVLGGLAHNIGQMAVAVLLTQTPALLYYLPMLLLCALATGCFTGLSASLVLKYLPKA